jgi:hypothetical protein
MVLMQDSHLSSNYQFKVYTKTSELPQNWDEFTRSTLFLQSKFLSVLEEAPPLNSKHFYLGVFKNESLKAAFVFQYIRIDQLPNILHESSSISRRIRAWLIKKVASGVLFCGNNLYSGHEGYIIDKEIPSHNHVKLIQQALNKGVEYAKKQKLPFLLTCIKDFKDSSVLDKLDDFHKVETQPSMTLQIPCQWESINDYVGALQKKYRLQYNRARNKSEIFETKELDLEDVIKWKKSMFKWYLCVMQNANFNTVVLSDNHFEMLKRALSEQVVFTGYFVANQLIGFTTYFIQKPFMETYFLGYDTKYQKTNLLYLNMLYDMIGAGIQNKVEEIHFGRTALEIKSSIGCQTQNLSLGLRHQWRVLHAVLPFSFKSIEPEYPWKERHVFKIESCNFQDK